MYRLNDDSMSDQNFAETRKQRRPRWPRAGVALAVTAMVAMAGFSRDNSAVAAEPTPSPLYDAAKAEGSLVWYTGSNSEDVAKKTAKVFEETYPGIKVQVVRLATGPMQARIAAEYSSGVNDVDFVTLADKAMFEKNPEWFVALDPAVIPNMKGWPAEYVTSNSVTYLGTPFELGYNTNKVKKADVPKSWKDVIDPKWRGQIILADPRSSPTYMNFMYMVLDYYGPDYVKALGEQKPKLVDSMVPGNQELAAGGASLGIPGQYLTMKALIDQGAPLEVQSLDEPNLVIPLYAALPSKSKHPNAAKLFFNWLLSDAGQQAECAGAGGLIAVNPASGHDKCGKAPSGKVYRSMIVPAAAQAQILSLMGLK